MNCRYACRLCAGWLAIAVSAPADIVWSGDQNLTGRYQYIDLNFDSVIDATLAYDRYSDPSVEDGVLRTYVDGYYADESNRILVDSLNGNGAAIPFGTSISYTPDPSVAWNSGGRVSYWRVFNPDFPGPPLQSDEEWRGLLGQNGNTYVGVEFDVAGATHYGWVNIALGSETFHHDFQNPITTSWAYESAPNTAIIAGAIPEPSTGLLTVGGSLALLMLARARRRGKHVRVALGFKGAK